MDLKDLNINDIRDKIKQLLNQFEEKANLSDTKKMSQQIGKFQII